MQLSFMQISQTNARFHVHLMVRHDHRDECAAR